MLSPVLEQLGISLLLGLLVGLQREHEATPLAGLRTFPLISLLGTLTALADQQFQARGLVVLAGLLAVVGVVVVGNLHELKTPREKHPGTTTELAMLVMFAVGAYLVFGERMVAVAVGGVVAVLLEFKPQLHGFVARLSNDDVRDVMQFVLITFVVLPILPDESFGPFDVLNPHETWLMVVLIVGISLGGYVLYKFTGGGAGTLLMGLLGGAVSSTATTVSYAQTEKRDAQTRGLAAIVIMLASTVVYVRVLVEIATVSPGFFPIAAPPILAMLGSSVAVCAVCWAWRSKTETKSPELKNPSELRSALAFAALYSAVLLAMAAAKEWLGGAGMYAVATLSGLTDMDAITLSTSRLVNQSDGIAPALGWRLIVVATMSNLAFKLGLTATLGSRRLLVIMALMFAVPLAVGAGLIFFWPEGWVLPIAAAAKG